jgi:hypothetical protein
MAIYKYFTRKEDQLPSGVNGEDARCYELAFAASQITDAAVTVIQVRRAIKQLEAKVKSKLLHNSKPRTCEITTRTTQTCSRIVYRAVGMSIWQS